MRITVTQMNDNPILFQEDWKQLVEHLKNEKSECVLLPEVPFSSWFGNSPHYDEAIWKSAVKANAEWIERLPELGVPLVVGTRAVEVDGNRLNEGFVWSRRSGYSPLHHKYYLPNEEGVWEANWGHAGDGTFKIASMGGIRFGYLICSEMWFFQHAADYAKEGIHFLLAPRKTETKTTEKWIVGGRAAAIVSGAYCLSSNSVTGPEEKNDFGGKSWIIDPNGEVLGVTDYSKPFLTLDLDLKTAERAKTTYPRNIVVPKKPSPLG